MTTANLIVHMLAVDRKWIHPLPMNTPVEVPNTGGVKVTLIDANHCEFYIQSMYLILLTNFSLNQALGHVCSCLKVLKLLTRETAPSNLPSSAPLVSFVTCTAATFVLAHNMCYTPL